MCTHTNTHTQSATCRLSVSSSGAQTRAEDTDPSPPPPPPTHVSFHPQWWPTKSASCRNSPIWPPWERQPSQEWDTNTFLCVPLVKKKAVERSNPSRLAGVWPWGWWGKGKGDRQASPQGSMAVQTNEPVTSLPSCWSPGVFLRDKHGHWTNLMGSTAGSTQSRWAHLDQFPSQSHRNSKLNCRPVAQNQHSCWLIRSRKLYHTLTFAEWHEIRWAKYNRRKTIFWQSCQ